MDALTPVLTLDEVGHIYRAGGRIVPGVTSILRQIDELEGIPAEYLERAAHFGRHVHLACDLWNRGELDLDTLDAALRPYLDGWILFLEQTGAKVLQSERRVYHPTLGYAGTLDAVLAWSVSSSPVLVDIKSSAAVPRSARPQTAAYREAYLAESRLNRIAKTRYVVHLTGDGKYKLKDFPDYARDWNVFLSCLNVHRWMEES